MKTSPVELNSKGADKGLMLPEFADRGYVILKGVFSPDIVRGARAEMEKLVDQAAEKLLQMGRISDPLKEDPFETRLHRLFEKNLDIAPQSWRKELHLAGLFDVFFNADLLDLVEKILGSEIRLYPNYTARPKLPEWEGTLVPWHQDGGYTENNPIKAKAAGAVGSAAELRMVNIWSPLVPARPENGCMQFVPGTHKLGVVPHVKKPNYLEIAPESLAPHLKRAVDVVLDPGDVVLFHNLLFHHGQPNRTRMIRWSLDWRYQDATQSTLREFHGHIARSRKNPSSAVKNSSEWSSLVFG